MFPSSFCIAVSRERICRKSKKSTVSSVCGAFFQNRYVRFSNYDIGTVSTYFQIKNATGFYKMHDYLCYWFWRVAEVVSVRSDSWGVESFHQRSANSNVSQKFQFKRCFWTEAFTSSFERTRVHRLPLYKPIKTRPKLRKPLCQRSLG